MPHVTEVHVIGCRESDGIRNTGDDPVPFEDGGSHGGSNLASPDSCVDIDRQPRDAVGNHCNTADDHRRRAEFSERRGDCSKRIEKAGGRHVGHGRERSRRVFHTRLTVASLSARRGSTG
jgi:hypothetical protein